MQLHYRHAYYCTIHMYTTLLWTSILLRSARSRLGAVICKPRHVRTYNHESHYRPVYHCTIDMHATLLYISILLCSARLRLDAVYVNQGMYVHITMYIYSNLGFPHQVKLRMYICSFVYKYVNVSVPPTGRSHAP